MKIGAKWSRWTAEEDRDLTIACKANPPTSFKAWEVIAKGISGRTGHGCCARWKTLCDGPSKRRRIPWMPEDVARMIHLRETERRKWTYIDGILKRPAGSSATKYEALRLGRAPSGKANETGGRIHVTTAQETERRARQDARMRQADTSRLLGEPPPGFSALDQRNAACGGTGPSSGTGRA